MFRFTRWAAMCVWIQHTLVRESRDQHLFVGSPKLIADFHALHRLLMPRHPPYTLSSLTTNIQLSRNQLPAEASRQFEGESTIGQTTDPDNDIASFFRIF